MFEKIFTYSSIDKKENHVSGVLDIIRLVLLIFPLAGLLLGLISCSIVYIPDLVYKRLYYLITAVLIVFIIVKILKWAGEMFMVYAISNDGRLYRFKMFSFAMNYLGLGGKIGEVRAKGMGGFLGSFELMMKIKKTIESVDNEQQIAEMFAQGYVSEFYSVKVLGRNENGIKVCALTGKEGEAKKITFRIRKVYSDWENLFNYLEYISENENGSIKDFHFTKKTTYEDFIVKRPSYIKRVMKQSAWVLTIAAWIAVITLSSDINKQSKINAGIYKESDARILSVQNQGKKSQKVSIGYQAGGREYDTVIRPGSGKYNAGDELELYYQSENPEKYIMFAFEDHINYKPILIIVLFCEFIILAVNIDIKKKDG